MTDALRHTFGSVAELYDRARPGYPPELFDELASLANLTRGTRVLEIGCGTGKATVALLERGYRVHAVELSPELAAVARRNVHRFEHALIDVGAFEAWRLPDEPFDAVVAAQAFHWIDPEVRLAKAAAALKPGGVLAVFGHTHVEGGTSRFFVDVQACYERFMPGTPPGLRLEHAAAAQLDDFATSDSGLFAPATHRSYYWEQPYTTSEYLAVLNTYSNHIALEPALRTELMRCIARLIDEDYGGNIRKAYLTLLMVARRADRAVDTPADRG